jgi:hypothetical protein
MPGTHRLFIDVLGQEGEMLRGLGVIDLFTVIRDKEAMARVSRSGNQRRGILELGAWLTAESNPSESSVVKRGQWVLDHISCTPANPPPANAATVLPDGDNLTVEQRLALHRTDPTCAACHDDIDPAGFGFEHFNAVGAPKVSDIAALGGLPDGTRFRHSRELAEQLLNTETFSRCFTQKLYKYALGRTTIERLEGDFIQDIFAQSRQGQATLVDLIKIIATSDPFTKAPTVAAE